MQSTKRQASCNSMGAKLRQGTKHNKAQNNKKPHESRWVGGKTMQGAKRQTL